VHVGHQAGLRRWRAHRLGGLRQDRAEIGVRIESRAQHRDVADSVLLSLAPVRLSEALATVLKSSDSGPAVRAPGLQPETTSTSPP